MQNRGIHQLVAGFSNGDAISNEARFLRDIFQRRGYRSEIYCESARILPELRKEARDISLAEREIGAEDLVILHLSIGSPVNELFPGLKGIKILRYHNVTPPEYFRALNDHIARQLELGREQMKALAGVADLNLADSQYNANELLENGYDHAHVHPLVLKLQRLSSRPNAEVASRLNDGKLNMLFVGRCAPNKRQEDLLHAFYYVQRFVEPNARLSLVGSFAGTEQYHALLKAIVRDLRLPHVDIVGSVPEDHLCAYYQHSHVFVCMSEHEGFGIPLLEAMQAQIPVLAYASSAVPETLDGAGVLFQDKHFDELGEWIVRAGRDPVLRASILKGQNERIERYRSFDAEGKLFQHLAPWMD